MSNCNCLSLEWIELGAQTFHVEALHCSNQEHAEKSLSCVEGQWGVCSWTLAGGEWGGGVPKTKEGIWENDLYKD
jgi:hypothetical protein